MVSIRKIARRLRKNDKGSGIVEFGIIAGLIGAVVVGAMVSFDGAVDTMFTTVKTNITAQLSSTIP
jgi:Flp pilus assembly pilin Flp